MSLFQLHNMNTRESINLPNQPNWETETDQSVHKGSAPAQINAEISRGIGEQRW